MQTTATRKSRRRAIGAQYRKHLTALVETVGLAEAASRLGISPQTVASLAAGFSANLSTAEHVETKLDSVPTAEVSK